jgi:D-erythronate 2-dehydrogenase
MTTTTKVLVTGAAGFLGGRLIGALLEGADDLPVVSTVVAVDTTPCTVDDPRVDIRIGTIANDEFVTSSAEDDVDLIYHLAAVLSGQAEAEFDLGMRINVDGTRSLLEACRRSAKPRRFIFSSTVAVFGGALPEVVPEDMAVLPQSSYGTEKAIAELLVNEYSRKGFIDGLVCRLPTVAIRPGSPNSAVSSFVSGIIREPLAGVDAICPVPLDTRLWICSPDVLTANLVHAARLPTSRLDGRRIVNLPGLSVTAAEMLESLERLAGSAARARVRCQPDEHIMRIVGTWPGAFDVSRALRLGFRADRDIDSIVRQYMTAQHASPYGGRR